MENITKLKQLIGVALVLIPQTAPEISKKVICLVDAITTPEKPEVWKELGDILLEEAENTSTSDVDAYFFLVVGSGCVGLSIGLKREENQKASAA